MIRHFLLFSLLLITVSCKNESRIINNTRVQKFIYFKVSGLTYDSLKNPHFGIIIYFDFNEKDNLIVKVARGKLYFADELSPVNGLENFFNLKMDQRTYDLIQKTLSDKSFDSTYNAHFEPRCTYFLYQLSNKEKHIITFNYDDRAPHELTNLLHHLDSVMNIQYRMKSVKSFTVDNLEIDIENKFFSQYPPPNKK